MRVATGSQAQTPGHPLDAKRSQVCARRFLRCSAATASPAAELTKAPSKCPFSGKGVQGLVQPADQTLELGQDPSKHFTFQKYDYAPFTAPNYQGKYKMTMGLEPMEPGNWIEIDEQYETEMAMRHDILKEKRNIVIHKTPESEEANWEMLELLADFLPQRFPDRFVLEGDLLYNRSTGDVWDLSDKLQEPLEICALLVQEDLCIMTTGQDGTLRFVSGAVLFPQRWSLLEKIGMDMRRIHDPVPFFNSDILKPVNAFMNRITPAKPFWRANWTISDNPELFQPLVEDDIRRANSGQIINDTVWGSARGPVTAENAGERLCTRCERETLSRFPRTGAILFTIRTHIRMLNTFQSRPDKAAELAKALRNLPKDLVNYKTIAAFKDQALAYLDSISHAQL